MSSILPALPAGISFQGMGPRSCGLSKDSCPLTPDTLALSAVPALGAMGWMSMVFGFSLAGKVGKSPEGGRNFFPAAVWDRAAPTFPTCRGQFVSKAPGAMNAGFSKMFLPRDMKEGDRNL